MHPRASIRAVIAARLAEEVAAGIFRTLAEDRVYADRVHDLASATLPAIRLYTRVERVAEGGYPAAGENGAIERALDLVIEGAVAEAADADDQLDTLALGVEEALEWASVPGLESAAIRLVETETDAPAETPSTIRTVRLVVRVTYRTPWRVVTEEDYQPSGVFLGFAPDIGAGHADDYERIGGIGEPVP